MELTQGGFEEVTGAGGGAGSGRRRVGVRRAESRFIGEAEGIHAGDQIGAGLKARQEGIPLRAAGGVLGMAPQTVLHEIIAGEDDFAEMFGLESDVWLRPTGIAVGWESGGLVFFP